MNLQLNDEQAPLLLRELDQIIDGDRYFLSPRIQALREIRALIKPYPERPPPSPLLPHYEPPQQRQASATAISGKTGTFARKPRRSDRADRGFPRGWITGLL
jgi:hypothetical protein